MHAFGGLLSKTIVVTRKVVLWRTFVRCVTESHVASEGISCDQMLEFRWFKLILSVFFFSSLNVECCVVRGKHCGWSSPLRLGVCDALAVGIFWMETDGMNCTPKWPGWAC